MARWLLADILPSQKCQSLSPLTTHAALPLLKSWLVSKFCLSSPAACFQQRLIRPRGFAVSCPHRARAIPPTDVPFFFLASPAPLCLWWAPVLLPLLSPLYKTPLCVMCVSSQSHAAQSSIQALICISFSAVTPLPPPSHSLALILSGLLPAASAPCRTGDTSRVISLNSIPGKRQRYPTLDSLGTYLGRGACWLMSFVTPDIVSSCHCLKTELRFDKRSSRGVEQGTSIGGTLN